MPDSTLISCGDSTSASATSTRQTFLGAWNINVGLIRPPSQLPALRRKSR